MKTSTNEEIIQKMFHTFPYHVQTFREGFATFKKVLGDTTKTKRLEKYHF